MSFDPNNAPTGSPEEVLGEDDDGGGSDGGDNDGGSTSTTSGFGRTTAPDPSDPPDPFDDGGDSGGGGSDGGDDDDSGGGGGGGGSSSSGGGGSSSSGSRTTAPDPSDPPDPDPSDVTRDPDPDTSPAPTDDDTQQAEGGDRDTSGDRTSGTTAPDPSDPPDPDPSDVARDADSPGGPEETFRGDTQTEGGEIPRADAQPGADSGDGEQVISDPAGAVGGRPQPEMPDDLTPEQREEIEQAQADVRQNLQERFGQLAPGVTVGADDIVTQVEREDGAFEVTGRLREGVLGEGFAASPSAASADVEVTREIETFEGAPMAAGPDIAEEQETFQGAPGAAGPTEAQLEAGAASVQRQQAFEQAAIESGAAEGAELNILPDQFTVEAPDDTLGDVAAGVAGGRRAAELDEAVEGPISGSTFEELAFSGPLGFAATQPEETQDALNELRQASQAGVQFGMENVVNPFSEGVGDVFGARQTAESFQAGLVEGEAVETAGADVLRNETAEQQPPNALESFTEAGTRGLGRGALGVTVGAPADLVTVGGTAGAGAAFAVENPNLAAPAAAGFTASAAEDVAETAAESPVEFGGSVVGGATVASALSPLRFSRVSVPRTGDGTRLPRPTRGSVDVDRPRLTEPIGEGEIPSGPVVFGRELSPSGRPSVDIERPGLTTPETTNVRGLRLRDPPVVEVLRGRSDPGSTLVGFRGARPTIGTPEVDLDTVDVARMGSGTAQSGPVFEPQTPFETDVFTSSARAQGGDVERRMAAVQTMLRQGENFRGTARAAETEDLEDVVRATEEISEDVDEAELVQTLGDIDATVFGSGAVRAQAPEFRDPGDIDIVVPDEGQAREALGEVVEGTETDIGAFDIKEPDAFAGLEEGEIFGFSRASQAPIQTEEGVRVNPIGEELQRKAGASGFIRGPEVGGEGVDIGARPARGPETPIREKDVEDTAAIGRELLGDTPAVREFESAFGLRDVPDRPRAEGGGTGLFEGVGDPLQLRQLAADETAQAQFGLTRADVEADQQRFGVGRSDIDADSRTRTDIDDGTTATRDVDARSATQRPGSQPSPSPSPGGIGGVSPSPGSPFGGGQTPSSPFGSPAGQDSPAAESPGSEPPSGAPRSPDSPAPSSPPGVPGSPSSPLGPSSPPGSPGSPSPPGSPNIPGSPGSPSTPPSTPPGSPGGPSRPPSGPPGFPGSPGDQSQRRIPGGSDADSGDDEEGFVGPAGTPFENPVATGQQFLLSDIDVATGGGFNVNTGDGDGGNNPDPTGLFFG